jgi:hypothetical protein
LRPHNPGEGPDATIDATDESSHHEHLTPCASKNVPFLSTEQSTTHRRTPQREDVGAPSTVRCMTDHVEQGQGSMHQRVVLIFLKQHFLDLPMLLAQ